MRHFCSLSDCEFIPSFDDTHDHRYCGKCGKAAVLPCNRTGRRCTRLNCGVGVRRDVYCAEYGTLFRYNAEGLPVPVAVSPRTTDPAASTLPAPFLRDLYASSGDPLFREAISAAPDVQTTPLLRMQASSSAPPHITLSCFGENVEMLAVRLRHDRLYAITPQGRLIACGLEQHPQPAQRTPNGPVTLTLLRSFWRSPSVPQMHPMNQTDTQPLLEVTDTLVLVGNKEYLYGYDASIGSHSTNVAAGHEHRFALPIEDLTDIKIAVCGDALLVLGIGRDQKLHARLYRLSQLVTQHIAPIAEETIGDILRVKEFSLPPEAIVARPGVFYFFSRNTGDLLEWRHQIFAPLSGQATQEEIKHTKVVYENIHDRELHALTLGKQKGVAIYKPLVDQEEFSLIEFALDGGGQPRQTALRGTRPHPKLRWCGLCNDADDLVFVDDKGQVQLFGRDNYNRPERTWQPFGGNVPSTHDPCPPLMVLHDRKWFLAVGLVGNEFAGPRIYRLIALNSNSMENPISIFDHDTPLSLGSSGNELYFIDRQKGDAVVQRVS